jgi:outer membrane protein OmpA-like peptidoglycan-associated protein
MKNLQLSVSLLFCCSLTVQAQQKKAVPNPSGNHSIPISNADLGVFPYVKNLPNFRPTNESDSVTVQQNLAYFYDGKTYFTVEGQVSAQSLNMVDKNKQRPSEFQIIQEFDKLVATLGGKKIYAGTLPEEPLKKMANSDLVGLASKHQTAPSAWYGVVEYAIKTPQKEVWIQLVPGTIASNFYTLLVVEKSIQLLTININKQNLLLQALEKTGKAIINLSFQLDSDSLLSESKDELLSIVNVFQVHPNWKLTIEVNNAPVGKPDYVLALTEKRATQVKAALMALGVQSSAVEAKGLGDTKPLVSNDTEKGRRTNTRVEITKL